MDSGLKQRLVGAAVLVALAVIFLPMLFDGSGAREHLNEGIEIPAKPEAPESRLERDIPDDGGEADASDTTDTVEATLATDEFAADGADDPPTEDATAATTEAPDSPPTSEPPADGDEPAADAAAADPGDIDEGWIVQVGSFRRETNALVLRDRLRQEGFDARAERVEHDGGTLWRVRLGPVAGRDEGEALKERIEDHRGHEALLMAYP